MPTAPVTADWAPPIACEIIGLLCASDVVSDERALALAEIWFIIASLLVTAILLIRLLVITEFSMASTEDCAANCMTSAIAVAGASPKVLRLVSATDNTISGDGISLTP